MTNQKTQHQSENIPVNQKTQLQIRKTQQVKKHNWLREVDCFYHVFWEKKKLKYSIENKAEILWKIKLKCNEIKKLTFWDYKNQLPRDQ